MTDFWLEHKTGLRKYIIKRVQDPDAVDDILQDVYLKAFTKLHTLKFKASISSWLFCIAANAIADYYRSQKPWIDIHDEHMAYEPERNCAVELTPCVQPFIADFPEIYQSALVLSELDGLTHKEVASRLGISLSAAKSRIQRGREKLRLRFLDCCSIEAGHGGIIDYVPHNKPSKRNNY